MSDTSYWVWVQFRSRWAGSNGAWEYKEFKISSPDREEREIRHWVADGEGSHHMWSERFRGMEWRKVDLPPRHKLIKHVEHRQYEINVLAETIERAVGHLHNTAMG